MSGDNGTQKPIPVDDFACKKQHGKWLHWIIEHPGLLSIFAPVAFAGVYALVNWGFCYQYAHASKPIVEEIATLKAEAAATTEWRKASDRDMAEVHAQVLAARGDIGHLADKFDSKFTDFYKLLLTGQQKPARYSFQQR